MNLLASGAGDVGPGAAVGGSLLYFGARRPLRQAAWALVPFMAMDVYLTTRVYNYDANLLYLPPPWFPTFPNSYTTLLFRQVPS